MRIIRIIAEAMPISCMACPLMHDHRCGKTEVEAGNGNARYIQVPDERCIVEGGERIRLDEKGKKKR